MLSGSDEVINYLDEIEELMLIDPTLTFDEATFIILDPLTFYIPRPTNIDEDED